jgi:hypothetical protein
MPSAIHTPSRVQLTRMLRRSDNFLERHFRRDPIVFNISVAFSKRSRRPFVIRALSDFKFAASLCGFTYHTGRNGSSRLRAFRNR